MERITGIALTFDNGDSLIDVIIERTEMYYKIHGMLPTFAYVPRKTTQEEINAIIDMGNIQSVIPQYGLNLVLVGRPVEYGEEETQRMERLLDDSEEQEAWEHIGV